MDYPLEGTAQQGRVAAKRFSPNGEECCVCVKYHPVSDGNNCSWCLRWCSAAEMRSSTNSESSVLASCAWAEYPWRDDSWRVSPQPSWVAVFQRWVPGYLPQQIPFPWDERFAWFPFWIHYRKWNGPPREPDWSTVRRILLLPPFSIKLAEFDALQVEDVVTYLNSIQGEAATSPAPIIVEGFAPKPAEPAATRHDARHSPDFRSVSWFGESYSFTANQAACVKILWEAWENETPEVSGAHLLEAADVQDSTQRIDLVFRGNPAWGAMIVPGKTKGVYRLKEPETKPAAKKSKTHGKTHT